MTLPDGDKTFEVSIAKPHTVGTMFNKHTEYAISVKTTMENYPASSLKVNRRYSDFEWLFNRLTRTFPGRVIPPIPEKQSRNRFDKDFVEGRRLALQKFIDEELKNMTVLNERLTLASSLHKSKAAELDALADAIVESMK